MCKEQEAEQYRMKLEAMSHSHTNGTSEQEEVVEEEEEEEVVVLQEGDIIIKTEELDSAEEQVMLVESVPSHTEVIS